MIETPGTFNERPKAAERYPAESLVGYRWHTGATLRSLQPDEPCPVLFRDLGPVATALFLRGQLRRLAGPPSPVIYMRTEDYAEPYTDYEQIGRLVFLRPLSLHPWHAGLPSVYVASASRTVEAGGIGFVPGDVPLAEAARLARELVDPGQWREALGPRWFDGAVAETLHRLDGLAAELAGAEERAEPLRRALQSTDRRWRDRARSEMDRVGLTETDLCAAWHHLPRERRSAIQEALRGVVL